jgi:hypothetical protein
LPLFWRIQILDPDAVGLEIRFLHLLALVEQIVLPNVRSVRSVVDRTILVVAFCGRGIRLPEPKAAAILVWAVVASNGLHGGMTRPADVAKIPGIDLHFLRKAACKFGV